jgi:hypothetical protein
MKKSWAERKRDSALRRQQTVANCQPRAKTNHYQSNPHHCVVHDIVPLSIHNASRKNSIYLRAATVLTVFAALG